MRLSVRNSSWKDSWRVRNPNEKQYTWLKTAQNVDEQKASRIDFALISQGTRVVNTTFCPAIYTDHRAVFVAIETSETERGKGYWKFNTSLLQDEEFVEFMNKQIDAILANTIYLNPLERWEKIKKQIATKIQSYTRKASSTKKLVISQLMEKIDEMQYRFPLNKQEMSIYQNSIDELHGAQNEYVKGVIFRSKAKWYQDGEKGTKYFLNLEKARFNAKTCSVIVDGDSEITDPEKILSKQKEFYQELYARDPTINFSLTNTTDIKVPESLHEVLNRPFNEQDIKDAVFSMKLNKTPGKDGISVDLYRFFWEKLKQSMCEMIEMAFTMESLPKSMSLGILNLIPKAGKDARLLKNLRPITLLNSDYKVIEKAISIKLKKVLPHIIHTDQTGFMTNRRISTNIRKLIDLAVLAKAMNEEVILLSCDFLKCFDRVEFTCIRQSLRYFGFSEYIIKWVDILYRDFVIQVQNNGHFSDTLNVTRSIHQGGCCSAELFIICAETLAIELRNRGIKGMRIKETELFLNQFADDTSVASPNESENLNKILDTFEFFRQNSGFTLNYDKTTVYRLGSLKNSDAKLYTQKPLQWSGDPFNTLGVWVTDVHEDLIRLNYDPIIIKVKDVLSSWENRTLSLCGKITVINSLVVSLFVYKLTVLPFLPGSYIKKIEDIMSKFLWNNRRAKIPLRVLQLSKNKGGLNLVNLRNRDIALKTTWVNVIHQDPSVAQYAIEALKCDLKLMIWQCNLNSGDIVKLFPPGFLEGCAGILVICKL